MKEIVLFLGLILALPAIAGQQVFLGSSMMDYTGSKETDWKKYHVELPLPSAKDGKGYELKVYWLNGQLALEGRSPGPDWKSRKLIGNYRKFYPDGTLKATGRYEPVPEHCECGRSYMKDGRFETYDTEGRPVRIADYKNGNLDGTFALYKDGVLTTETHYIKGRLIGLQKSFHPNGQLKYIRTMDKQSRLVGESRRYNRQGELISSENIVRDRKGSIVSRDKKHFNDQGTLVRLIKTRQADDYRLEERHDSAGKLTWRAERDRNGRQGLYLKTGSYSERAHYRDNTMIGAYESKGVNGELKKGNYNRQGKQTGKWVSVDRAGKVTRTTYRDGIKNGSFSVYDKQGHRIRYATYVNGTPEGKASIDTPNYRLGSYLVGIYRKGKLEGSYTIYSRHGKILEKGQNVHGEPDGVIYTFSTSGRMIAKKTYRNGTPDGEWLRTGYNGAITSRQVFKEGKQVPGAGT